MLPEPRPVRCATAASACVLTEVEEAGGGGGAGWGGGVSGLQVTPLSHDQRQLPRGTKNTSSKPSAPVVCDQGKTSQQQQQQGPEGPEGGGRGWMEEG